MVRERQKEDNEREDSLSFHFIFLKQEKKTTKHNKRMTFPGEDRIILVFYRVVISRMSSLHTFYATETDY